MPRGRPKKNGNMSPQVESPNVSVMSILELQGRQIGQLTELVDTLIEDLQVKTPQHIEKSTITAPASTTIFEASLGESGLTTTTIQKNEKSQQYEMVPSQWSAKVDELLGKEFETEIWDSNGNFILKVYMPDGFDRRVGAKDSVGARDFSTGLVRRGSELSDITKWCCLIGKNIQSVFPTFHSEVDYPKLMPK